MQFFLVVIGLPHIEFLLKDKFKTNNQVEKNFSSVLIIWCCWYPSRAQVNWSEGLPTIACSHGQYLKIENCTKNKNIQPPLKVCEISTSHIPHGSSDSLDWIGVFSLKWRHRLLKNEYSPYHIFVFFFSLQSIFFSQYLFVHYLLKLEFEDKVPKDFIIYEKISFDSID